MRTSFCLENIKKEKTPDSIRRRRRRKVFFVRGLMHNQNRCTALSHTKYTFFTLFYISGFLHVSYSYFLFSGLLLVSTSMFFTSLLMFTFPKNLRSKTTQVLPAPAEKNDDIAKTEKIEPEKFDESSLVKENFFTTIKRQLKNDILMFRTASAVLHLLPITGLYVFLPKYLENQFNVTISTATLVSGTCGILVMGVGILITGIISVKFPLSARKVAAWIAFTALFTAGGMILLSSIGCSSTFKDFDSDNG